ncbi:ferrochelatase [Paenibacillus methanolicus]|uniref:Coproporphyrin III ferrochelatase n=1 Tax=Paenibacillus methanolicus TaxID=582686 RepID=A0A5S5C432_9BACL|nr:ferrochelatase [Paenibacillus methanolicus]TYP73899.1 ferrochelatase [Paenibacillus methanolicus]
MSNERIAVLVMSYGTPENMDDVEAYYTHIRRGHPPTPELLAELKGRYEAVTGGVFPLRENTDRQVEALQQTLDELAPGRYVCYQGLKHARPYIEDGVEAIAKDGFKQAVGIVLAPHYSVMSVGGYNKRAKEKATELGVEMTCVDSYHLHPKLVDALVDRVVTKLAAFDRSRPLKVLFSAHSLPVRIRELGDPYEQQLLETSDAVAKKAGVQDWEFTWQSAGRTHEPWLGPDILDTMKELSEKGYKQVLSAPIGFVSDHLEVLYDLDIEAKALAEEIGVHFERIAMLNTDRFYMETLAETIIAQRETPQAE